jgi:glycosyltransferase involved in cell wall biosynthesis
LVDPTSTNAIAEAMFRVAFEPGLRDSLAERARRRSALYSWDRAAEATAAVFADAANGGL